MGIVTYFGKDYGAPIYRESYQIPTPVGTPCMYCEEPILEGEDGFRDGGGAFFHRECLLRGIIGSVSHQSKTCSCYTRDRLGCEEDGISRREGARRAVAYWEAHP